MATVGNNSDAVKTMLRDKFLTKDEKVYTYEIFNNLRRHKHVQLANAQNSGMEGIAKAYDLARAKIESLPIAKYSLARMCLMEELNALFGYDSEGNFVGNALYDLTDIEEIYYVNNFVKVAVAEALVECVEMGMFNSEQMVFVENTINILLSTIEDNHMEQEKERTVDDIDMER